MKRFMTILAFVFIAAISYGQSGKVFACTVDTVQGNENIYITTGAITGNYTTMTLQALFTQITSAGGTAYVQGSVDGTTYVTLTETAGLFHFYPNDTVTMTNGGTMYIVTNGATPFKYYRYLIDGDTNDTMIVTAKYILK